ncbi:ABC transporter ATP-binding protein [Rhodospira trueperi]|uniref:sn-glycerol 3-phosphate transport system ATP-binding protein n=1 Tax=Rhodospira trueperi TaxID=69960 RepID=A0A1G7AN77_9PROT|nr:ABC transporter ATP-binding protein [Rhodospira trueperi]SDE16328.1 sn-glycerol 3-phosphate transport system ATP-binding protein [Rhodospira trueperi]
MSAIAVEGLVKRWDGHAAVDGVSFTVPDNSLTVLLGPSGCGKSTILRLIAGLETASAGQVTIGGRDVTGLDPAKRGVSMVFQSYALFPHLTVAENILFGLKVRRVAKADRARRLETAARMVGLDGLLDRKPASLSGGQRQRVALARTIVAEQPVCLMDEPLSNLDAKLRAEMRDEIRRLQRALGLTMVYVTHDQTEAMTMADAVVLLNAGRIEQQGPPPMLYERPATAFAARFIGQPPMNLLRGPTPGTLTGVRPEDVMLNGDGRPARVEALDYLGAETLLRLSLDGEEIIARAPGRGAPQPGETVRVAWPAEAEHLFEDTGIRRDGGEP